MENRLKPETTGIIGMLRNASIRTIMVTGKFGHCCGTVAGLPLQQPEFNPRSSHVFVLNTVAQGQVFFKYFSFSCQILFHQLLHIH
jgi:hypothetical protein